uniref:Uncharacterized protein n=1 Tax=Knipowitschia caucasica TaxID=637954 RepID=A0AAV2LZZ0_KNICA
MPRGETSKQQTLHPRESVFVHLVRSQSPSQGDELRTAALSPSPENEKSSTDAVAESKCRRRCVGRHTVASHFLPVWDGRGPLIIPLTHRPSVCMSWQQHGFFNNVLLRLSSSLQHKPFPQSLQLL